MLSQKTPSEIRDAARSAKRQEKARKRREWIDRELALIREMAPQWIKDEAEEGESHCKLYQACFVNGVKKDQYDFLGPDWKFAQGGQSIAMDNLMAEVWNLCQSMASTWGVRIELHNHTTLSPDKSFNEAHNYCICAVW